MLCDTSHPSRTLQCLTIKYALMAPKSVPIAPKPTWIRYKKGFVHGYYFELIWQSLTIIYGLMAPKSVLINTKTYMDSL
jgi:hypothetical protein